MTLDEFKAWFDTLAAEIADSGSKVPSRNQWEVVKANMATITDNPVVRGTPQTVRVKPAGEGTQVY